MMKEKVAKRFTEIYHGSSPQIVRSPGRINIIGEHTDYNNGFVLPAAIDKAIYIAVAKRNDDLVYLYAEDYNQHHSVSLDSLSPSEKQWPNFILGVADQLQKRGYKIYGFNLVIDGDVPLGAGLSSSAAVECATVFALNELFDLKISKLEMVQISQIAEQTFAGLMCGIMDQFASMFGKKNNVIKLDCRSLEYEYVPLELKGYKVVLLNTNVKHSLSSTEYNTRRQQCEKGIEMIRKHIPGVNSLRDADIDMLKKFVLPQDELIYKRCKFVIEETGRVQEVCTDLKEQNIQALGKKMFRTHEGLSHEYEVSCKELDFLVNAVKDNPAVVGARMMGGGFGGCTINIVKEEAIEELIAEVTVGYKNNMQLDLTPYIVQIENGTEMVIA